MEILNSGTAIIDYLGGFSSGVIAFGLIGIISIIVSMFCEYEIFFKILVIFGFILIAGAFYIYKTNNPVEVTTYQVILDDNISYNDFVEKYEVIKQEGRVYTIYEKKQGELNMEFILFMKIFIALAVIFFVAAAAIGPNFLGKTFIVLAIFCLVCSVTSVAFSKIYTEVPTVSYYERK